MLQRRINNWTTVSDRGIKCLESYIHTSGIGAFYTFGDIFRRTFDRLSGIRWCCYPVEIINENRRRVLTKLIDGFCFRTLIYNNAAPQHIPDNARICIRLAVYFILVGDVGTMCLLFFVNSVHGLNCNVLLTAQWCVWMKRFWIIN